jgi:Lon-like ATP-dependent protease
MSNVTSIITQVPLVEVCEANLADFVGKPLFTSDRLYARTPAGIATGLAWTSMGGSVLCVEAALSRPLEARADGRASAPAAVVVTGHLGKVMKVRKFRAVEWAYRVIFSNW